MLAALLAACSAPRFAYEPQTLTSAEIGGRAAASYPIPAQAPRGDAQLASFGITDLPRGFIYETPKAIRVALVVSNRSDDVWHVDVARQRLEITSHRVRIGIDATTQPESTSIVDVPPRSTRWIDLYFPLPEERDEERELGEFEVFWKVNIDGGRTVEQRTRFERRAARTDGTQHHPEVFVPAEPLPSTLVLPRAPGPLPDRSAPPRAPR